jgi:CDP-diacylglycerol--glycerol-3-phosphate 3-phosphatidyltransferase
MVILIISREYIITGLRSMGAAKNIIIPANKAGKFKTTSQIVSIIALMLVLIVNSALHHAGIPPGELQHSGGWRPALGWSLERLPFWLMFITTVLTIVSGWTYLSRHRDLLKE